MNAPMYKRPLTGGVLKSCLKEFQVRGWLRMDAEAKSRGAAEREPLSRVEVVTALSPVEAAKAYARSHQIRESLWNDGTSRPFCVIRVSDAGQTAPAP